jgi:Fe-S oxidoreductase
MSQKTVTVSIYNLGCCGMAGSFGYEKNIMTLVCKWGGYFISKIRSTAPTTIAAAGTSCRHQILMERIETPNIRSLF